MRLKNSLLLLFTMLLSAYSVAQHIGPFVWFNADALDSSVKLEWRVQQGAECYDITVQRSLDSVNFEDIHLFAGACGSWEEEKYYSFTDENPAPNRINYYRLESRSSNRTEILKVNHKFIPDEKRYVLYPQPAGEQCSILIENRRFTAVNLKLYNLQGILVEEQEITQSNEITIRRGLMQAGTYIFVIEQEEGDPIIGKMIFY